jgi:hypothetical protein
MFAVAVAALCSLVIGFVWYSPTLGFGKSWMKETGLTEEKLKGANMPLIFGLTFVLSFLLAFVMQMITIHQMGFYSMFEGVADALKPETEVGGHVKWIIDNYGTNFRTFKHGALHGFISSIFIALPIIGINSLFERKSAKYIFIHWGYWALVLTAMGAIVCGWQ